MPDVRLLDSMRVCGLVGDSWSSWRVVAKVLDGEPLDPEELTLYRSCTGRSSPPSEPPREAWLICGRRAGKSRFAAAIAVRALSRRYATLAPGESAVVAVAASDRQQARVLYNYSAAPFSSTARSALQALAALVTRKTRWEMQLTSGTSLEVHTAQYGKVRGRTFAVALADEVAFWSREDGTNPASEVLAAIRPSLVTLGGPLIIISSPFSKSGPLWDTYQRSWARDDDSVLVWQAPSRVMNPSIPQSVVTEALERDPEAAKSEWLAIFRDDEAALVTDQALKRVIRQGEPPETRPSTGHRWCSSTSPAAVGPIRSRRGSPSRPGTSREGASATCSMSGRASRRSIHRSRCSSWPMPASRSA